MTDRNAMLNTIKKVTWGREAQATSTEMTSIYNAINYLEEIYYALPIKNSYEDMFKEAILTLKGMQELIDEAEDL